MKTRFFTMAAIAAATVMTSCSKDEAVNNDGPVAVKFSSGIADVQTRANETTWDAGDPIGIFMYKTPGALTTDIAEGADNIRYNAAGGSGTVSFVPNGAGIYYPVSGDVKFVAYYPYSGTVTGFKLPVSPSVDAMYAAPTGTYSKTSSTVNLEFEHKLVKLVFSITNGGGVTEPLSNGVTVAISGQQTTGELNLTDGVVTTSGSTSTITATGGATVEAIVLPNTGTSSMGFTFTNNAGETFTGSIPALSSEWTGGNKYTYTVTLQKNGAVITGAISPWTDGGSYYITGHP